MRYAESGELHLDFHGATNMTIDYVAENYGEEALRGIFKKVGEKVYKSIREGLRKGDDTELIAHWRHFLDREDGDYDIKRKGDAVTLTVHDCPAVRHVKKLGMEVSPHFCDQTVHVNRGLCAGTDYEIDTVKTGEGSCVQTLRKRAGYKTGGS